MFKVPHCHISVKLSSQFLENGELDQENKGTFASSLYGEPSGKRHFSFFVSVRISVNKQKTTIN